MPTHTHTLQALLHLSASAPLLALGLALKPPLGLSDLATFTREILSTPAQPDVNLIGTSVPHKAAYLEANGFRNLIRFLPAFQQSIAEQALHAWRLTGVYFKLPTLFPKVVAQTVTPPCREQNTRGTDKVFLLQRCWA